SGDPRVVEAKADSIFDEVLDFRRQARRELRESLGAMSEAHALRQAAVKDVEEARDELVEVEARLASLDETDLGSQQRAVAELRVKLQERRLQMAEDVELAHEQKHLVVQERAQFYHETVESVLTRISRSRRSEFFSMQRSANWSDAFDGVGIAIYNFSSKAGERLEQVIALPGKLFSPEVLGWLMFLAFRLALFPIAYVVGKDYGPRLLRRLTDQLLKRRFFRAQAGATIKVAEILRALLTPAMFYVAVYVLLDYVVVLLPEMQLPRWIVDAVFIYWVVMTVVQVLVLPRGYRERMSEGPSPNMKDIGKSKDSLDALIDVVNLEINRARKLVSSVRIVLIFWLLGRYIPEIVIQFMGHSLIWWAVDRIFTLGFIGVVYYVLSAWKDDIAHVFERLAKERMPRAVFVVKNHKDRIYGVLLIGAASLYVVAREGARLIRAWVIDTEWSRRVSNFMFRKKIELQQRERDKEEFDTVTINPSTLVPDEYTAFFEDGPLTTETYRVSRADSAEKINRRYRMWLQSGRQGSVAFVGESGLGKTTVFNQIFADWSEKKDRDVQYVQIIEKCQGEENVRVFLSRLFNLKVVPRDRRELIEAVKAQPPRVLILDDCHHLFFRRIGGFRAIDLFFDVVNTTDGRHFWILSFNSFAWSYLNRMRNRQHYFGEVIKISPWTESEIRQLILSRDAMVDIPISFADLVVTHETEDEHYEIVKTSEGFFRLLHEFCQGNPRVALLFWLRSLKLDQGKQLQVSLFRRPPYAVLASISDQYLFALAAVAQHGGLSAREASVIIHADHGLCEMAMNFMVESDIITVDPRTARATISTLYFRAVLKQLGDSNFIYE
ncbi:MAG: AAA family ATPase, partial [Bradymonadaceae bacterium]